VTQVQFVNLFMFEMRKSEKESEKRKKLDALELSENEWEHVSLFLDILAVSMLTLSM
jgi:hypothetical protein